MKPKVVVAENVKGMLIGNAKGYTKMIMARLRELGYRPQCFLFDAADCGVPQRRERVFFCAIRSDLKALPLALNPKARWISVAEATSDLQELTDDEIRDTAPAPNDLKCWSHTPRGGTFADYIRKTEGRVSCFNHYRLESSKPSNTLSANPSVITHWDKCRTLTLREWKRLGSFPDDYETKSDTLGKYLIGMSVPPRMTEVVANAIITQWL